MCGTSRKTLEILRDSGADVWIQEYLKNPPARDELKALYERAGITQDFERSSRRSAHRIVINFCLHAVGLLPRISEI